MKSKIAIIVIFAICALLLIINPYILSIGYDFSAHGVIIARTLILLFIFHKVLDFISS